MIGIPMVTLHETKYVPVRMGEGGPVVGVAKVAPDGTADIILLPACSEHDKPTKIKASLDFRLPPEIR